jgi:hypothetical protein
LKNQRINNNRQKSYKVGGIPNKQTTKKLFSKIMKFSCRVKPQVGGISHTKGLRMREYGPLFWKFAQPISKH